MNRRGFLSGLLAAACAGVVRIFPVPEAPKPLRVDYCRESWEKAFPMHTVGPDGVCSCGFLIQHDGHFTDGSAHVMPRSALHGDITDGAPSGKDLARLMAEALKRIPTGGRMTVVSYSRAFADAHGLPWPPEPFSA